MRSVKTFVAFCIMRPSILQGKDSVNINETKTLHILFCKANAYSS